MKRQMLLEKVLIAALFCCNLWNTACVNKIDEEIEVGNIPISFTAKTGKAPTKTNNNIFEKGDKVGLFAMIAGIDIDDGRYIDNLPMTCGDANQLIPSKNIFFPEGEDIALDFVSYYPYYSEGPPAGGSTITVSVQADQSSSKGYSQSDFLIAKASNIASTPNPIELKYQHKMTRIRLTLTPGENTDIDKMLKDNPRIVANGFATRAEYDLKTGTFSNPDGVTDIIASGTWKKEDNNRLVGKEFIIIPQSGKEGQTLLMEWNGRVYNCPFPTLETTSSNTQYEINISSVETNSHILSGAIGTIEEWNSDIHQEKTNNKGEYAAVHLSVLSFSNSKVYRIYSGGKPIAEICKEYLNSKALMSQAIVSYPVQKDETTDLSKGTVLQLLGTEEAINGGTLSWDVESNGFSYTPGKANGINVVYYDTDGNVLTQKPESPINVNILQYTLRDTRDGLQEYPIVKVGTQYWMAKSLRATSYQDGSPITKRIQSGEGPGYFKPTDYNLYFYNGEALLENSINPIGWKIPSPADWDKLIAYINKDASLLKTGKWEIAGISNENDVVTPVNNLTLLSIYPSGIWHNGSHANAFKVAGFWSWDEKTNSIPGQTVFFMGQSNEVIKDETVATGKNYYKGLSVRCIKE